MYTHTNTSINHNTYICSKSNEKKQFATDFEIYF